MTSPKGETPDDRAGPDDAHRASYTWSAGILLFVAVFSAFFAWAGTQVQSSAWAFWCFVAAGLPPIVIVTESAREWFRRRRGWYVDKCRWYPEATYCEWRFGRWARICLPWADSPGNSVLVPDEAKWRRTMPLWARMRRDEIAARVRSCNRGAFRYEDHAR